MCTSNKSLYVEVFYAGLFSQSITSFTWFTLFVHLCATFVYMMFRMAVWPMKFPWTHFIELLGGSIDIRARCFHWEVCPLEQDLGTMNACELLLFLWISSVQKTLEASQSHNCYKRLNRPILLHAFFKLYPPLSAEKNPQMQDELNHLPLTTAEFRRSSPLVSSSGAAPSNWRGWARRHRIRKARVW